MEDELYNNKNIVKYSWQKLNIMMKQIYNEKLSEF